MHQTVLNLYDHTGRDAEYTQLNHAVCLFEPGPVARLPTPRTTC